MHRNRISQLLNDDDAPARSLARYKVSSSLEQRLYATTDANHNVTSIDDVFGAVKERFVYDPYRNSTVLTSAWASTSVGYSWTVRSQGEREDATTNTINGRSRIYGLGVGRWLQADFAGYVDGANQYQTEIGNPISWLDPSGLKSFPTTEKFYFLEEVSAHKYRVVMKVHVKVDFKSDDVGGLAITEDSHVEVIPGGTYKFNLQWDVLGGAGMQQWGTNQRGTAYVDIDSKDEADLVSDAERNAAGVVRLVNVGVKKPVVPIRSVGIGIPGGLIGWAAGKAFSWLTNGFSTGKVRIQAHGRCVSLMPLGIVGVIDVPIQLVQITPAKGGKWVKGESGLSDILHDASLETGGGVIPRGSRLSDYMQYEE